MPNKARVFLSYARRDGEAFARRLRRRIEAEQPEITIWQDRTQMEGGVGWWTQITTALETVEFLILIMTPAALKSEVSRKEWRYARQAGVCVYPVKGVHDSELDFGAMPLWMRTAHFFDLDREWDTFIQHLKSPCHEPRVPFMAPDLPVGFVRRSDATRELLDSILDAERQNPRFGSSVLYGGGGLGKTSLVTGLCHDEDVIAAFPGGILWATLGENPRPVAALAEIYAALTGERPRFVNEEDAANEVSRRLEDRHCLIVIDDVWSPEHLKPLMRGGSGCTRLITTRQFEVAVEFFTADRRIRALHMKRGEAVEMLLSQIETVSLDRAPFRALAERLGQWPLMLKLARGAMRQRLARGDSLPGALRYVNEALDVKGFTVFDSRDASERHSGLSKTIQVSLDLLDEVDRQSCFQLSVFPEDIDIPIEHAGVVWGRGAFDTERLAERLDGLSLMEFDLRKGSIRLHDLMRDYFRRRLATAAVAHQRLIDAWGDPRALPTVYAWKWYLYHLTGAGRDEAALQLLTDFAWLQSKLGHTGVNSVLADYEYIPGSQDLRLVRSAIRLAAHTVNSSPGEFAAQLLGRLTGDSPAVATLRKGAERGSAPVWLRPVCASLTQSGGPILRLLTGHEGPIRGVAMSSDGMRVASASSVKDEVKIWDVDTWSVLQTLTGHSTAVNAVDINATGRIVLSGSDDRTAKLWNADTGDVLFTLAGHTAAVRAVALARVSARAVTGFFDRSIKVWDLETGEALHNLAGHSDWIRAIVMTDEGDRIVSSSMDGTFRVWDAVAGTELQVLRLHAQPARALALCPGSLRLISGSDDGAVKAWNIDGSDVRTLCEAGAAIQCISVSADGRRAISLSVDDELCLWDLETFRCIRGLTGPAGNMNTVAIAPSGLCAITGSHDETLRVWDLESAAGGPGVHGHLGWVNAVAIDGEGRFAASGSYDGTLKIWDAGSGRELHNIKVPDGGVRAVAMGGGVVISGSERGTLGIWDPGTAQLLSANTESSAINALAIDASGNIAVSGSPDGSLRFWDLKSRTLSRTIRGHSSSILAVSMNMEGTLALSASSDTTVRCWDVKTGCEVHTLRGHRDFVRSVSVAPGGVRAVSGTSCGGLKVWELSSGLEILDVHTDIGNVNAVVTMPCGHRAITGSGDHTVRLWDLDFARSIACFTVDDVVTSCAVSADARTIVAGDASGAVHFLRIEEQRP